VLMNNLWKKKAAVIVAAVFILTLLALDLNALLLQGKWDVSQARAALPFSYYFGHAIYSPNGQILCPCCGWTCAVIVLKNREITIPLIPLK